jgi:hypothetical protein
MRKLTTPFNGSVRSGQPISSVPIVGLVIAICVFAIVAKFSTASAAVGNSLSGATPKFSALVIVLDLSSDRAVYHVGEVIDIRVGIHNTGARDFGIIIASPWSGSKLLVTDNNGTRLKVSHEPNTADYESSHGFVLGAGKTSYLSWAGREWSSLDN